jgi:hypothetical protein
MVTTIDAKSLYSCGFPEYSRPDRTFAARLLPEQLIFEALCGNDEVEAIRPIGGSVRSAATRRSSPRESPRLCRLARLAGS